MEIKDIDESQELKADMARKNEDGDTKFEDNDMNNLNREGEVKHENRI